jgi:hypothetical protein
LFPNYQNILHHNPLHIYILLSLKNYLFHYTLYIYHSLIYNRYNYYHISNKLPIRYLQSILVDSHKCIDLELTLFFDFYILFDRCYPQIGRNLIHKKNNYLQMVRNNPYNYDDIFDRLNSSCLDKNGIDLHIIIMNNIIKFFHIRNDLIYKINRYFHQHNFHKEQYILDKFHFYQIYWKDILVDIHLSFHLYPKYVKRVYYCSSLGNQSPRVLYNFCSSNCIHRIKD